MFNRFLSKKTTAFALPLVLAIVGVTTVFLGYFLSRSIKSVSIEGSRSKSDFQKQRMDGEISVVSQRLVERMGSWIFDPEPTVYTDAENLNEELAALAATFTEYNVSFECLWEGSSGKRCNNRKGPYAPGTSAPRCLGTVAQIPGQPPPPPSFCRGIGNYNDLPKVFRIEMSRTDDDGNWSKLVKTISISRVRLAEYSMIVTDSAEDIRLGPATFESPVFLNFDLDTNPAAQILLDNSVAPISFNKTFETNLDSSNVNPVSTTDNPIFYGGGASFNDTSVDIDTLNQQILDIAGDGSNWDGTSAASELSTVEFQTGMGGCSLRISETVAGVTSVVEANLAPNDGQVIVLNGPVNIVTNNNPWCKKSTFLSSSAQGVRLKGSLLVEEGKSAGVIATSGDITIASDAVALNGNPLASQDTSGYGDSVPVTFQSDFALYSSRQALKLDPSYLAPGANEIGSLRTTGTYITKELPFFANQNDDDSYNGFRNVQRSFNPLLSNEETAAPGFNTGTDRLRIREVSEIFSASSDQW